MSACVHLFATELTGIHGAILRFYTEVIARIHMAPAGGVVETGVWIVRIPSAAERVNIQMRWYLYGHIDLLATGGRLSIGLPARSSLFDINFVMYSLKHIN